MGEMMKRLPLIAVKPLFLWFVVVMMSLPAGVGGERLYQWTDENGTVHLTREPPPRQGKLNDIMDYSEPATDKAPAEPTRPSNTRDPLREEKIMLELERRRLEAEQSAIQSYEQEQDPSATGPNNCYVQLPDQDMYVRVFNVAESGSRADKIWSGWMKKNERRLFSSRRGQVSIDFKIGPDAPYHTLNIRICDNGGTIQLQSR
jgi:hypothetical protein